ncbi:MAG: electron transport complex subunit RsxE [Ignavibacteriales bacterium]
MKVQMNDLTRGVILENPLLRLMIGLCSALAVSVKLENTLFMGIAVIFVLTLSNVVISLIRPVTPDNIRIPIFLVVVSSFVTIVDLVLKAYFPEIYARLGVWIPLIVVNCIILGRAEAFAYHNGIIASTLDGLGMGAGYTLVLMVMGTIRELLGTGSISVMGATLVNLGSGFQAPTFMITFPGAFLTFGLIMGGLNKMQAIMAERAARRSTRVVEKTAAAGGA